MGSGEIWPWCGVIRISSLGGVCCDQTHPYLSTFPLHDKGVWVHGQRREDGHGHTPHPPYLLGKLLKSFPLSLLGKGRGGGEIWPWCGMVRTSSLRGVCCDQTHPYLSTIPLHDKGVWVHGRRREDGHGHTPHPPYLLGKSCSEKLSSLFWEREWVVARYGHGVG